MKNFLRFNLIDVFSIDLRSLALVRIAVALIILTDIIARVPDLRMFYGDGGVLPSSLMHSFWAGEWAWSLHLIGGGDPIWVGFLLFIQIFFALLLLFGFWTRIATVVTWVLIVSLHNANPLILQGGDFLLRAVLFVAMFLPWGARFSVDARSDNASDSPSVLSGWSVAFLLQVGIFYLFASLFKSAPEWTDLGSAVYYTLAIDQYATALAKWMLQFPEQLQILTFSILNFQHIVIFLLFSPIYTRTVRTFAAVSLILMHLSFALMMHLGMFSWIAIAALIAFIPSDIWDLLPRLEKRIDSFFSSLRSYSEVGRSRAKAHVGRTEVLVSLLGIVYLAYIFLWQAGNVVVLRDYLPDSWEIPAKVLRIDQRWNLFAPYPYRDDGWYVVRGVLADGTEVDLYRRGAGLTYDVPKNYYALYPNTRWRKYGIELRQERNERYRPQYARYLCAKWDAEHSGATALRSLDIMYMLDMTPPPGEEPAPIRPVTLLSWECAR